MFKELMYKWFDLEPLPCASCETLRMQLAIANDEKRQLLESILHPVDRDITPASPVLNQVEFEKLKPKMMTWNVRKQMLEAEDRAAAALMREQREKNQPTEALKQDIEKLEKELGVEDAKT
jgi:hypothetical protein